MITTEVDPKKRLAIHRYEGTFNMADVRNAMQKLFANREFVADFSILWDLRNSDIEITLADILRLDPEIVKLANAARPSGKTAWVASTALGESILQLLYSQHNWAAEWRTFSKLEAALSWCQKND